MKYHPDRKTRQAPKWWRWSTPQLISSSQISKNSKVYNHSENAYDYGDLVAEVLNKILSLDGLIVEVVGNWLWISGNTKDNKEALKEMGCMYAPKKVWYYRPEEHRSTGNRKSHSMEEIREKYGTSGAMHSRGKTALNAA